MKKQAKNKLKACKYKPITNGDIQNVVLQSEGFDKSSLAVATGRKEATVWNWLNNRTLFPAFAVPAFTATTGDFALIDLLCGACGGYFQPYVDASGMHKDLRSLEHDLNIEEAMLEVETEKAISPDSEGGSRIVKKELRRITKRGLDLIRKVRLFLNTVEDMAEGRES